MTYVHGKKYVSEEIIGEAKEFTDGYEVPGYERNQYELNTLFSQTYHVEERARKREDE